LVVDGTAKVAISNSTIRSNFAHEFGGGMFVSGYGIVNVSDTIFLNNTVSPGTGSRWASLAASGGGAVCATGDAVVRLLNNTKLVRNAAYGLNGGGFVLEKNASLDIRAGVLLAGNTVEAPPTGLVLVGADGVIHEASKLYIGLGVHSLDRFPRSPSATTQ
jgi:hypothetical protein